MPQFAKPFIVIVAAVLLAVMAAVMLTRTGTESPDSTTVLPDGIQERARHERGPADAPVTLVEFGDYQCPSCAAYHPIVNEILRRYPRQVRLEYRHYPLVQIHANAMAAAVAAEAAGEQGRFWDMHDLLFEYQPVWGQSRNSEAEFLTLAQQLDLDMDRFVQSMRSPELQQRVLADVVEARDIGVDATPTFFLNGRQVRPRLALSEFVNMVESELQAGR